MNAPRNRRILLVDDSPAIHEDFHKILLPRDDSAKLIDQHASNLFGGAKPLATAIACQLESAFQGPEAVDKVRAAMDAGQPYAMAFVDMRMPPGWDGLETIRRLWQVDPDLEAVICTAYSDHSWQEIQRTLGTSDRLLILKKPFDKVEVQQLALALTEKWTLRRLTQLHTDGLADLVRQRTSDLVRTHQSRSDFLVKASEELLTPMKGILETASGLAATGLNPEQREFMSDLQRSGERLLGLLHDLLQFNTIESGKLPLDLAACDLRALCREAVEPHAVRARAKGLKFDLSLDPNLPARVQGYPDHIRRVLCLLLDSAIAPTGHGAITVSVRRALTAQHIEFAIADTGRGICADQVANLKYPSVLSDSGFLFKGVGISLALANRLVGAMEGRLEFESKPGQGSTFRFTLPLGAPARARAAA